jgi:hypothetical protein
MKNAKRSSTTSSRDSRTSRASRTSRTSRTGTTTSQPRQPIPEIPEAEPRKPNIQFLMVLGLNTSRNCVTIVKPIHYAVLQMIYNIFACKTNLDNEYHNQKRWNFNFPRYIITQILIPGQHELEE